MLLASITKFMNRAMMPSLVQQADQAMYAAKRIRKERVADPMNKGQASLQQDQYHIQRKA